MFSTVKGLIGQRAIYSFARIPPLFADLGISVHELTCVLNTHAASTVEWPPGLQEFYAFNIFTAPQGVVLLARQLQGSVLTDVATKDLWVGTETGSPHLILSKDSPLPVLPWLTPLLDSAKVKDLIADVRATPYIHKDPADRTWWAEFETRYTLPGTFSWTPTTPLPVQEVVTISADICGDLAKELDLTLTEVQKVSPLPISWFWSAPRVQTQLGKMSQVELANRGSSEVLPLATSRAKQLLKEAAARRKPRRKDKPAPAEGGLNFTFFLTCVEHVHRHQLCTAQHIG
jgi:hypothetical protein